MSGFNSRKNKKKKEQDVTSKIDEHINGKSCVVDSETTNEPEHTWDEVSQLYASGRTQMARVTKELATMLSDSNVDEKSPNYSEILIEVTCVKKVMEDLANKLTLTYEKHSGKTGAINDEDEIALSMNIYIEYLGILETLKTAVMPSAINIAGLMASKDDILEA